MKPKSELDEYTPYVGKPQTGADRNRLNQKNYEEGDLSDRF